MITVTVFYHVTYVQYRAVPEKMLINLYMNSIFQKKFQNLSDLDVFVNEPFRKSHNLRQPGNSG